MEVRRVRNISVWILFCAASATWGADTVLDPYAEPVREKEVRAWDPAADARETKRTSRARAEQRDDESAFDDDLGVAGLRNKFKFFVWQLGYAGSFHTANGPDSPSHQFQLDAELGVRKYRKWYGWDWGCRVELQTFGGQTGIYGALAWHFLTGVGQWGLFVGPGYRSAYNASNSRLSPVTGLVYRWWDRTKVPQSQYVFSPQFELDYGPHGVRFVLSFLFGQDWQW